MIRSNKIFFICFFLFYMNLSLIKFFTAEVRIIGEAETGYLVIKPFPGLYNSYGGGEETSENLAKQKDTWFFKGLYLKTGFDYLDTRWILPYLILILLWWVLSFIIFSSLIFIIFRKFFL